MTHNSKPDTTTDLELARRVAPLIRFDAHEPFLPSLVGYTIFHDSGPSPLFPRYVPVDEPAARAIEYALWWDWIFSRTDRLDSDRSGGSSAKRSQRQGIVAPPILPLPIIPPLDAESYVVYDAREEVCTPAQHGGQDRVSTAEVQ